MTQDLRQTTQHWGRVMARQFGRRVGSVLVTSVVFTTIVGIPGANGARAAHKPDLVVTAGHVNKRDFWYFSRGDPATFKWGHRTKNVGRAQSRRSPTGFRFLARRGKPFPGDDLEVPALSPGHAEAGVGRFREHFDDTWEFGTYAMKICADVHDRVDESDERNNCKKLHRLYVVPGHLMGTVTGTGPLDNRVFPGVTVSWKADVHFGQFFQPARADDGLFDYLLVEGSVKYKIQGTDSGGCTWNGSGTYNPSTWPALVHLAFGQLPHYSARDIVKTDYAVTTTITCPGHQPGNSQISPSLFGFPRWFDTGPHVRALKDPGLVRLSGRYVDDQRVGGHATFTWNLEVT
jgi:hypothetical protein